MEGKISTVHNRLEDGGDVVPPSSDTTSLTDENVTDENLGKLFEAI